MHEAHRKAAETLADKTAAWSDRVARCLDQALPAEDQTPRRLHEAMRYAVLSGGKRVRPLLVYATGECLDVDPAKLDAPATAIELIHAFSLVHDDLPAMDDDDLRRGQPTVHRKFDEATAILAADALQPLAFEVIASAPALDDAERSAVAVTVAQACGAFPEDRRPDPRLRNVCDLPGQRIAVTKGRCPGPVFARHRTCLPDS
jgi:farnesyl diphosphate synthase